MLKMRTERYQFGDRVKVKSTGRIGNVTYRKTEEFPFRGKINKIYSYGVTFEPHYTTNYYKEEDICYADRFEEDFEREFAGLMINVYLKNKNIPYVKVYADIKNKLERSVEDDF
jgi:hypothetical protein